MDIAGMRNPQVFGFGPIANRLVTLVATRSLYRTLNSRFSPCAMIILTKNYYGVSLHRENYF